jgi:hypothetical protein
MPAKVRISMLELLILLSLVFPIYLYAIVVCHGQIITTKTCAAKVKSQLALILYLQDQKESFLQFHWKKLRTLPLILK